MKKLQKFFSGSIFIKNAALLTVTALLLRGIGMYFRIYISALIGAEGMGLYQLIISVYALFAGFASSGIAVAVTRMTADELAKGSRKTVRLVLSRCMLVSCSMGIISALLLVLLANPIGAQWISDVRSISSVRIMALSLPFMSVSCCLRGYFTARSRVLVPSVAQIIEQLSRIAAALALLQIMLPKGIEYACFAILLADVISEGLGCVIAVGGYLIDRRRKICVKDDKTACEYRLGKRIWEIAAPITASHYLSSILRTVESVLVPDCLARFTLSRPRALELFGMVKGMALPLILFPSTLLTAFSSLLIPEISRAAALGSFKTIENAVRRSMNITFGLSIPIAAAFFLYHNELGIIVYNNAELGRVIAVLAPFMPLMYVESVTVGILRGLGEQRISLIYSLLDSVLRILLIVLLAPEFGLNGFLGVMIVSNLLTPLLHLRRLMKTTGMRFLWREWVFQPLLATLLCAAAAYLLGLLPFFAALPSLLRVCAGCLVCSAAALRLLGETGLLPRKKAGAQHTDSGVSEPTGVKASELPS